jgi:3-oxoacyl-[acyl-carrier protein] reductase
MTADEGDIPVTAPTSAFEPIVAAGLVADRVAIVTGGAQGIGGATTRNFLANGAKVCVADLDADKTAEIVATWGEDRVLSLPGDVTEPDAAGRLVAATLERFGQVDILVNNAGYYWDAPLHRMTDEQFEAMLQIHTVVPFRLMREVLTHWRPLAKQEAEAGTPRHRKIVNVSSRAALRGLAGAANYAAGKAGLLGLTYSAAKEYGKLGVNVNAVAFGPVSTRFGKPNEDGAVIHSGGHEIPLGRAVRSGQTSAEAKPSGPRRSTISGRAASPREAADAILYLCSSLSDLVNGEVLQVNG